LILTPWSAHQFADHGVKIKGLDLDLGQMLKRKLGVVKASNDGVAYLFRKNKIQFFHGRGAFGKSPSEVIVGGQSLQAKHVIVATGSNPRALPGTPFDEKLVLSNTGALAMPEVPKRLGVIGAGVIGLEMGSVWRRLGAQVDPRSAACVPRCGRRADRARGGEDLRQAGPRDRARRDDRQRDTGQEGRERRVRGGGQKREDPRMRPAHRLDRPRAEHARAQCRGRRAQAR
jgi:hypothetical protein